MTGWDDGRVMLAAEKYVKERFGDEADRHANYGWFIDDVTHEFGTKVYGHGVVTTNMLTLESSFEPFLDKL